MSQNWKEAVTYERSSTGVNYLTENATTISSGKKKLESDGSFSNVPFYTTEGGTGTTVAFDVPSGTQFMGPIATQSINMLYKNYGDEPGDDNMTPEPISSSDNNPYTTGIDADGVAPFWMMGTAAGGKLELVKQSALWGAEASFDSDGNPQLDPAGRGFHSHDSSKGYLKARRGKITSSNVFTHATTLGHFTLEDIANGNTTAVDVKIIEVDESANDCTIQLPYTPAYTNGIPEITNMKIAKANGSSEVSIDNPMAVADVLIASQGRILKFNYDETSCDFSTPIEDGELASQISVTMNYWDNHDTGDAHMDASAQAWSCQGVHAGGVDPSVNDLLSNSGVSNVATYQFTDNYKTFGTDAAGVANYDNTFTVEYNTDGSETQNAGFKLYANGENNNSSRLFFNMRGQTQQMEARRTFSTADDDPNTSLGASTATINLYDQIATNARTGDIGVGKCTTNVAGNDVNTGVFILTETIPQV